MILKNDRSNYSIKLPRKLGVVLLAVLGIVLLFFFLIKTPGPSPPPLLYCDAEQVENGHFINGGYSFSNGQTQSDDYARSGQYSSKLAPGQDARFGLTFNWTDFKPGARYEASIWRRQFGASQGQFVVSGDGPAAFYQSTAQAIASNPDGWEQIKIQFALPPGDVLEKVSIYVYTTGPDSVYFDDFKLIQITAANFETFQPRQLHLRIGSQSMDKLRQKRREALQKGLLETQPTDWVSAQFWEEGLEPIPVEVRLKGDWLDHLRGDKWSFRVKCKSGSSWNRLLTFSLHTPAARYFLHEWLLHQFWEKEDVLTSKYDFAELFLNGKSLGIYAYEEHFEKQLVESRERREGPILKFSEAGFWAGMKRQLQHHGFIRPNSGHTSMNWENAPIEAFNDRSLPNKPILQSQFFTAYQRLEQFQRGELPAAEIFDIELLAKYAAISDLLQAYHGIVWHNQRFYYNPVNDKLEPIGFDGFGQERETSYTFLGEGALHPQGPLSETFFSYAFQDPEFTARYIHYLYQYTDRVNFRTSLDNLTGEWNSRLAYLQNEFPEYQPSLSSMEEQAQYIHSLIQAFDQYSLIVKNVAEQNNGIQLELRNTHLLPLEVVGYGTIEAKPQEYLTTPLLLPAHTPRRLLTRIRTSAGRVNDWNQLKYLGEESRLLQGIPLVDTLKVPAQTRFLFYRVLGLTDLFKMAIPSVARAYQEPVLSIWERYTELLPNPAYEIKDQDIFFKPGKHTIQNELFFPAGYTIHIPAGTQLNLTEGARIISQSTIKCQGSAEQPVRFYSSDDSGQGLLLMNEERFSTFHNTVFEGLRPPTQDSWQLTGAVTVYRSNVNFRQVVFRDMQSEDALNLIRSNFNINGCVFNNNASDGLDSDFCKGKILHTRFLNIINDGLDISGSIVEIVDGYFDNCGDKGISVGEESDLSLSNTSIQNSPIAVACKDLSTAFLRNISLINCQQGFAAFQKKAEFGPGYIFVESYTAQDVKKLYNIAPGSSLQLEERLIR